MSASKTSASQLVWTIGHSTHAASEFNRILLANEIERLVDVRSFPGSRRNPQFNQRELASTLDRVGVEYHHLKELGGRRPPSRESKNTNLSNASFRAYADHMSSVEFMAGIEVLLRLARDKRTVIMCSEAVWWRCHRSLVADYLKAAGHTVIHILSQLRTEEHPYTSAARIVDNKLTYEGLF